MNMPGGFSPSPATSAHDPLNARALVMDDGKTQFAWVVIDNLGVPRKVVAEAKELAAKATGIPVEHMLVSGTHTHSGVNPADEPPTPDAKLSDRDAKAAAYVECTRPDGSIVWGVGIHPDVATASVRAVLSAANAAAG